MTWTRFMDMHSGGGAKVEVNGEDIGYIYIEAPEEEAGRIFTERFNYSPYGETCSCCGSDYSINEEPSLEAATEFDRRNQSFAEWISRADVAVIRASERQSR